jgi:hypothetical protein
MARSARVRRSDSTGYAAQQADIVATQHQLTAVQRGSRCLPERESHVVRGLLEPLRRGIVVVDERDAPHAGCCPTGGHCHPSYRARRLHRRTSAHEGVGHHATVGVGAGSQLLPLTAGTSPPDVVVAEPGHVRGAGGPDPRGLPPESLLPVVHAAEGRTALASVGAPHADLWRADPATSDSPGRHAGALSR